MGELSEYLKDRYSKNHNSEIKDMMAKQRVKNSLSLVFDEYLKDAGDLLTFEVLPAELPYALSVLTEEPFKSKYVTTQISNSLFTASLQEVDLGL